MNDPKSINFVNDEDNSPKNKSSCTKGKLAIAFIGTFLLGFIIAFILSYFIFKTSDGNKEVVNNNNNNN